MTMTMTMMMLILECLSGSNQISVRVCGNTLTTTTTPSPTRLDSTPPRRLDGWFHCSGTADMLGGRDGMARIVVVMTIYILSIHHNIICRGGCSSRNQMLS